MSSKIFPPRLLAPSADDPLREDREAEVDASSVVCLVFVASRSIIKSWLLLFFFSKISPAGTKREAHFCVEHSPVLPPQKNQENLPTHSLTRFFPKRCRTHHHQIKSFAQRKKKKTPEFKIAGKAKETRLLLLPHARAREHTESTLTRTYARYREGLADGILQRALVLSR